MEWYRKNRLFILIAVITYVVIRLVYTYLV